MVFPWHPEVCIDPKDAKSDCRETRRMSGLAGCGKGADFWVTFE